MRSIRRNIGSVLGRLLCRLTNLRNRVQIEAYRRELGSVHPSAILEHPLRIVNGRCVHIGAQTRISWGGWLWAVDRYCKQKFYPEIHIGKHTYLGSCVHIIATKKIWIGDDVLLADKVYVSDNLHGYEDTRRPVMWNDLVCCGEVHIGDGSWIGENVCIAGNIRIGRNCVVGSNAVVRRNLPDYSVAVGIPARVVKRYHSVRKRWERTDPEGRFTDDPEFGAIHSESSAEKVGLPLRSPF